MAVGAARSAIYHREPDWRWREYRYGSSRKGSADGYTLLSIGVVNTINASLYDKLNLDFIRDIAPVAGIVRLPHRDGGESINSCQHCP